MQYARLPLLPCSMRRGGLAALEVGRCKLSKAELNIYILLHITKMMAGDTALLLPIKNFLT